MARSTQNQQLQRFRRRVEKHIPEVEDSVGFLSDEEWKARVLMKLGELSDPVNTDDLAKLCALIQLWWIRKEAQSKGG